MHGAALTVGGRLMVLIVGVGLVVGVDVLFVQGWWRRRGVRSLHPRRQKWNGNPGGGGQILTFQPGFNLVVCSLPDSFYISLRSTNSNNSWPQTAPCDPI